MMQEVNVQVAVRARPLLPRERVAGETVCVQVIPALNQIVVGRDRAFTFDHVFSAASTQEEVFNRCIEPLVQSCFEGYNATVFAYGQTGSGKTYTIGGGSLLGHTHDDDMGMIARAVQQIFAIIQNDQVRKFTIKVSYVELYREELHDLVDLGLNKDIHIREDSFGNIMIVGAAEVECYTADDVLTYLERGSAYRHTGSTQMNEKSSRSHSVFTIIIEQRWMSKLEAHIGSGGKTSDLALPVEEMKDLHYKCAKFHFVDLAGSERVHRTGNVGERFKESVHINTGLLALGNVISALGDVKRKTTHIPYRDSKITRLLKDSLGGNAKTLMICCVSPSSANFDESLNSLKYANRARNIRNKPIVNVDPQTTKIEVMETEIKSLREQLFRATSASTFVRDVETGEDPGCADLRRELERCQTMCMQYKALTDEAYLQLTEFRDQEFLNDYQNQRLCDWLELLEEMRNRQPSTFDKESDVNPTIRRLQKELEQCQRDLQNDAEIFLEKTEEVSSIREKVVQLESDNEELIQRLEEAEGFIIKLKEELLAKHLEMDELLRKIKDIPTYQSVDDSLMMSSHHVAPHTVRSGAKSAPIRQKPNEVSSRNIHTSPAAFTIDRMLHNFRAHSQLLANRLEDEDDVLMKYGCDFDEKEEQVELIADGKVLERNVGSRRTYRVKQSQVLSAFNTLDKSTTSTKSKVTAVPQMGAKGSNMECLGTQTESVSLERDNEPNNRQKLKQIEASLHQSTVKFRNLTINIRMKEQLIRQLVKNEKDAQEVNRIFLEKIQMLEKEKSAAKREVINLQKEFEMKQKQDKALNEQLQSDFRSRMEEAKANLKSLKLKQKDTESLVNLTTSNKKIQELQMSVCSMQKQQVELQSQLKLETELQVLLQKDIKQKCEATENVNQRLKPSKTERITASLRDKTESELQLPRSSYLSEEQLRLEEQRKWLDQEMEKLLEQRKTAEELEKALRQREELVAKKEAMLAEKRELEMKALRTSQVVHKDMLKNSSQVDPFNQNSLHSKLSDEVEQIQLERDKLHQERNQLNSKMQGIQHLSTQEQRKFMEIDETIEAMDAALEYKSELIDKKQLDLRRSCQFVQNGNSAFSRLHFLSLSEARSLLEKYFDKVVDLRDEQRRLKQRCEALEMAMEDEQCLIRELEASLQHSAMELERKLLVQQQDYEQKLQMMMKNITGSELSSQKKITEVQKELFFYKTACRDLKKKLRELHEGSHSVSSTKPSSARESQTPAAESVTDTPRHLPQSYDSQLTSREISTPQNATPYETGASHHSTSRDSKNGQLVTSHRNDHPRLGNNIPSASPRGYLIGTPRDAGLTPRTPRDAAGCDEFLPAAQDSSLASSRESIHKDSALVKPQIGIAEGDYPVERNKNGSVKKMFADENKMKTLDKRHETDSSTHLNSNGLSQEVTRDRKHTGDNIPGHDALHAVANNMEKKFPRTNGSDKSNIDSKLWNDARKSGSTQARNKRISVQRSNNHDDRMVLYDSLESDKD